MNYDILEKDMPGIYVIVNLIDSRIYIGSSNNLYKRYLYHRSYLLKGLHDNRHLQSFCNKYGIDKFSFRLIEYCVFCEDTTILRKILLEREQYYLDNYNISFKRFNLTNKATGGVFKHTAESKLRMSITRKGVKRGEYSEAHCKAVSEGLKNSEIAITHLKNLHKNNEKRYVFRNPAGELIEIINLKKFCELNNLSDTKMVAVDKGRRISHRGWTKELKKERKVPCHYKTIYKYTTNGVFIEEYSSLEKAAKSVDTTNTIAISDCAKMKNSYKGFMWRFEKIKNS